MFVVVYIVEWVGGYVWWQQWIVNNPGSTEPWLPAFLVQSFSLCVLSARYFPRAQSTGKFRKKDTLWALGKPVEWQGRSHLLAILSSTDTQSWTQETSRAPCRSLVRNGAHSISSEVLNAAPCRSAEAASTCPSLWWSDFVKETVSVFCVDIA